MKAIVIFQEALGVVVVGGAGLGPLAKLYNCPARQIEVGYLGAVAIKPVEVILEILLVAGYFQRPTLFCCLLGVLKEFVVMLVHGL